MSTKDLNNEEAVKKLKNLAESAGTCMFCTSLDEFPINSRPMSVQEVDADGNLWFISSADSNKNFEIGEDKRVQLFFINNGSAEYLSVYGKAFIYTDKETIEENWSTFANAWFDGKDDPKVTIIRVASEDVYYWDTKAGKVVSMLSFAKAIITGENSGDGDGVEGKLNV